MTALPGTGVALVGPGAIGAMHARALRALGATLRVVVGPDAAAAREFAAEHGVQEASSDLAAAFGADVDAVVIATPHARHAEQAVAALTAGKHVLCELPLGLTVAQAESVALAVRPGQVAAVCHTQRYLTGLARWRRLIDAGDVEPLHLVTVHALSRRENVGWTGRRRSWADDLVWHHGAHAVDTARWLLGDELAVVSAVSGRPHPVTGAVMDLSVTLATPDGRLATCALSYNADRTVNEHTLITASGTLRLRDGAEHTPAERAVADAISAQDDAFLRAVGGAPAGDLALVTTALPVYRLLNQVSAALAHQDAPMAPA